MNMAKDGSNLVMHFYAAIPDFIPGDNGKLTISDVVQSTIVLDSDGIYGLLNGIQQILAQMDEERGKDEQK
nr:MAG TPA: hypothetical protein [Caudoviricetes sp.]